MTRPTKRILPVLSGFLLCVRLATVATAATLYWDGTGTVWGPTVTGGPVAWSTSSSATTPNPSATPTASDLAVFNISTVNTAQTVDLFSNYSALGLVFNSTGSVLVRPYNNNSQIPNSITVGASGITIAPAAGPVTSSANVLYVNVDQTWTNNSANTFTVVSWVDLSNGTLGGLGRTLTVAGPGNFVVNGAVNASSKLVKNGTGTLTLGAATDNIGLTLVANAGTVILDKASVATPGLFTEVHAVGAGLTVAGALVQVAGTGGDQIYQSATVDVQTGTFDMNGRNEGFNQLKLAGSGIGGVGALVNNAPGTTSMLQLNSGSDVFLTSDTTVGGAGDLIVTGFSIEIIGNYNLTKVGAGSVILPDGNLKNIAVTAGTLQASGPILAATSGVVTIDTGASFRTRNMNTARTFNVNGTLEVVSGQNLQLTGGQLINNGTVTGKLTLNNGGIAKGIGSFDVVTVNDGGAFEPGTSPGATTVATLSFADTAAAGVPSLSIEIAGTSQGTGYDQLRVTGALTLAGTLNVLLTGGFSPVAGNTFEILDFGTLTGTFSTISLPTLAPGLVWDTSQLYTDGSLAVAAVPEPQTLAICLVALTLALGTPFQRRAN